MYSKFLDRGCNIETSQFLLRNKLKILFICIFYLQDGLTALSIATDANDKKIAKLLLDNKADPNLPDSVS